MATIAPPNLTCLKCMNVVNHYRTIHTGKKTRTEHRITCSKGHTPQKNCKYLRLINICDGCHCGSKDELIKVGKLRLCSNCIGSYRENGNYKYVNTKYLCNGEIMHQILCHGLKHNTNRASAIQLILNNEIANKAEHIKTLVMAEIYEEADHE